MRIQSNKKFKELYGSKERIVILRGGTRSAKTHNLIQHLLIKLVTEPNKRTIVVRKTLAILKDTFIFELQEIINEMEISSIIKYYKHTSTIWCFATKSSIKFIGSDEPLKFRGLSANYWVFNEANEIPFQFFQQAILRMSRASDDGKPNQFFLDFNPSSRFSWVKTKIEDVRKDIKVIKSTYKDNPFLSLEVIKEIELLKETDPDAWTIFGLGEYTDIIGAIYKKFKIVDEFPKECKKVIYGLDFGFTNDPTALIKIGELSGQLYYEELLYKKALTNQDIAKELSHLELNPHDIIISDSAEPKSIEEIKRLGWRNIKGAVKGPDSVKYGISVVKNYTMNVIRNSNNMLMELNLYKWHVNRNGDETNKPVDKYNHLLDAARYACVYNWATKPKGSIKVF